MKNNYFIYIDINDRMNENSLLINTKNLPTLSQLRLMSDLFFTVAITL